MGGAEKLATIRTISATAACRGPKFDYETKIYSSDRGDLLFQQFFTDRKYIAGIQNGRGWEQDEAGGYKWLDSTETAVLRGHEFPMMLVQFGKRFRNFQTTGRTQFEGQPTIQVAMTDEFGNAAISYFSPSSGLPVGLTAANPRSEGPRTITLRFDAWKTVDSIRIISHVTILFGSEAWVFDFKTLQLNAAPDSTFDLPKSLK
jgi:hypothetical protein